MALVAALAGMSWWSDPRGQSFENTHIIHAGIYTRNAYAHAGNSNLFFINFGFLDVPVAI